ncbi:MAG: LysM peptidoglycan-binding domain-containing protein [Ilumatobacteraceae bacterium]|nr:LysM peptidoglycan-binding domain-containing protein [Ilumatobacteraceae bacterium]
MRKLLRIPLQHREMALAVLATAMVLVAGCSNSDLSLDPLPPIQTTTTTTTMTTIPDTNRYFYEVRSGDTLSAIAAGFGVPMKQIVELNELENASDIRVGEIIEIPQGFVIVTLPPDSTIANAG